MVEVGAALGLGWFVGFAGFVGPFVVAATVAVDK